MVRAVPSSLKGASLLVLLQVGSRALTFALNQLLLRFLSPETMGVSAQLELFSISVLFFARESLRVALQRQTSSLQSVVNVAYLAPLLGVPLALLFRWLYASSQTLVNVPYIGMALDIQAVATVVELLAEPGFAVAQQKMLYSVRAGAETVATIARCVVTFAVFSLAKRQNAEAGVLPFALGQLSYAVLLVGVYTLRISPLTTKDNFAITPRAIVDPKLQAQHVGRYFSRPICTLAIYLYVQSGVKYVLTQGDAIIVTAFTTLSEQGAYALASNYGGLIARLLFQPIEESSRNLFAKLCTTTTPETKSVDRSNLTQAADTLRVILRLYNIMGLLAFAVGPTTAPLLLQIVAGRKWAGTGADAVLGTYCYLIPLLALNGVTEAFVAAVATHAQLRHQSLVMAGYFVAFSLAAWILLSVLELGAQGLVLANCVNMGCRVVWNTWFCRAFFRERNILFQVNSTLPSAVSIAGAVAVAAVLSALRDAESGLLIMLAKRGAMAAGLALIIAAGERHFLRDCLQLVRPNAVSKVAGSANE